MWDEDIDQLAERVRGDLHDHPPAKYVSLAVIAAGKFVGSSVVVAGLLVFASAALLVMCR